MVGRYVYAAGVLLLTGCTSTIEGGGAGLPDGFDIAVGAEVTLTFKNTACSTTPNPDTPRAEGCLAERPRTLGSVSLGSGRSFTVVSSTLERSGEVIVKVRAQAVGDTFLVIEHTDVPGKSTRSEFTLRAREITDVKESVACQWPDAPSRHYPVTRGSTANVKLTAMADATPLLSGGLDLVVDRAGTELLGEPGDGGREVRFPSAPGIYAWKVAGTRSQPITFDVYDPANVGIDLGTAPRGLTVRPAVNGAPVCTYEGRDRASVRVAGGSCRLVVGDFEIDGTLPVALDHGGATLGVTGGSCTIEATLRNGGSDRVTITPDEPAPDRVSTAGEPIGEVPIETGGVLEKRGACGRVSRVGNGKCEAINAGGYALPDGDCFSDWKWDLEHREGSSDSADRIDDQALGIGLLTELRVSIEFSILFIGISKYLPNSLGFGEVPPPGVQIDRLGCSGKTYEALGLRPISAGSHALGMKADNALNPRVYNMQARAVANMRYLKDPTDDRVVGSETRTKFFVASTVELAPKYMDGGGARLRGVAPVRISGTAAGALIQGSGVLTGTTPSTLTLASPAAAQTHVIDVVDGEAIGEIDGLGPASRGDERCIEPFPKAAGQRIHGTAPIHARVSFAGTGCAVGGGAPWAAVVERSKLCVVSDGTPTEIGLGWGAASAVWNCTGR